MGFIREAEASRSLRKKTPYEKEAPSGKAKEELFINLIGKAKKQFLINLKKPGARRAFSIH
jgi:hypothetical protein